MTRRALLFGYGSHGRTIAKGLKKDMFKIIILDSDENNYKAAKEDGYLDTVLVDVTKDRQLEELMIENDDQVICVMDDEHLNVFLTLSLRSLYNDSFILSISDSIHTTRKLKMAGANKVINLYEISANRIHNILRRPRTTKLLDGFVTDRSEISFKEMLIPEGSFLDGKMVEEVNFGQYNVLLVGMIDEELGHTFVFITTGVDHKLDVGDTIVCIGRNDDLEKFERRIGQKENTK